MIYNEQGKIISAEENYLKAINILVEKYGAEDPELAYKLYNEFIQNLKNYDINVKKGRFGAHMQLSFINDGPVTIILSDEE